MSVIRFGTFFFAFAALCALNGIKCAYIPIDNQNYDNRIKAMCDRSSVNDRLAHPNDCNKFVSCSPSGPMLFECPGHLMYSIAKKLCDWPENVDCSQMEEEFLTKKEIIEQKPLEENENANKEEDDESSDSSSSSSSSEENSAEEKSELEKLNPYLQTNNQKQQTLTHDEKVALLHQQLNPKEVEQNPNNYIATNKVLGSVLTPPVIEKNIATNNQNFKEINQNNKSPVPNAEVDNQKESEKTFEKVENLEKNRPINNQKQNELKAIPILDNQKLPERIPEVEKNNLIDHIVFNIQKQNERAPVQSPVIEKNNQNLNNNAIKNQKETELNIHENLLVLNSENTTSTNNQKPEELIKNDIKPIVITNNQNMEEVNNNNKSPVVVTPEVNKNEQAQVIEKNNKIQNEVNNIATNNQKPTEVNKSEKKPVNAPVTEKIVVTNNLNIKEVNKNNKSPAVAVPEVNKNQNVPVQLPAVDNVLVSVNNMATNNQNPIEVIKSEKEPENTPGTEKIVVTNNFNMEEVNKNNKSPVVATPEVNKNKQAQVIEQNKKIQNEVNNIATNNQKPTEVIKTEKEPENIPVTEKMAITNNLNMEEVSKNNKSPVVALPEVNKNQNVPVQLPAVDNALVSVNNMATNNQNPTEVIKSDKKPVNTITNNLNKKEVNENHKLPSGAGPEVVATNIQKEKVVSNTPTDEKIPTLMNYQVQKEVIKKEKSHINHNNYATINNLNADDSSSSEESSSIEDEEEYKLEGLPKRCPDSLHCKQPGYVDKINPSPVQTNKPTVPVDQYFSTNPNKDSPTISRPQPARKDPSNNNGSSMKICWCFPLCPAEGRCPKRPQTMPMAYDTLLDVIGIEFFHQFDPMFKRNV